MIEACHFCVDIVLWNLEPLRQGFLRAVGAITNADRAMKAFILKCLRNKTSRICEIKE